jgi:DNA-directed RNA polymerase subunit RPC12/RpoP
MINNSVKITCKRCGRPANSDEFILDHIYGQLVCPACIKDRKTKRPVQEQAKEMPKPQKPKGWDNEDEALERISIKPASETQRIDDQKIHYACTKCKYKFVYHVDKKYPNTCPYCGSMVML